MTETKDEVIEIADKTIKGKIGDWRERFFEIDLLSPIYVFLFIVLFRDGIDGYDLHDAIIKFIANYNGT